MNIKNKLVVFFAFSLILTLTILNIKNPEKTKFYLFTSKIERISLGNLITLTFISGFTFSSFLSLISKNHSKSTLEDTYIDDEEIYKFDESNFNQELEYNRPPQRDVRESQPTISVNYRFVDQENNSYGSENSGKTINNNNNKDNDWGNYDNEW